MSSHPDFICVGAQKAATTWLHDVLLRVPGVYLSKVKELHYFSQLYLNDASRYGPVHRLEQVANIRRFHQARNTGSDYVRRVLEELDHIEAGPVNDDWYRGIFRFAQDHEICGEVCPCYMGLPVRGVRHVMSINPLMRIIIIVRDPVERAWSHMRMHIKFGVLKLNNGTDWDSFEFGPYLRYTDYATAIPRWEHFAAENRVKVMLYDRIASDAHAALDEILAFIGLPGAQTRADLSRSVFVGPSMSMPEGLHERLLDLLMPQYTFLAQRFPDTVHNWLEKHKRALNAKGLAQAKS